MTAHVARHDDGIARLGLGARRRRALNDFAHARGGDEHAVNLAAAGHLGVSGNQRDACLLGGGGHGIGNAPQVIEGVTLLNHEGAREIARTRPHAREVVHRAADGQLADVAAREERGRHDEAVGGHGDLAGGAVEHRRVVRREERALEACRKDAIDEFRRLLAAGAHGQRYLSAHCRLPPY